MVAQRLGLYSQPSISSQRLSLGLRSGYSSVSTPNLANHVFIELDFSTRRLSCWNKFGHLHSSVGKLYCYSIQRNSIQMYASEFVAAVWGLTTYRCNVLKSTEIWQHSILCFPSKKKTTTKKQFSHHCI